VAQASPTSASEPTIIVAVAPAPAETVKKARPIRAQPPPRPVERALVTMATATSRSRKAAMSSRRETASMLLAAALRIAWAGSSDMEGSIAV